MQRTPIIAGNWKMHKTIQEARDFARAVRSFLPGGKVETVICAPFTALAALVEELHNYPAAIGAQNVHWEESGAYTGEISPGMLVEIGVKYVIIGHSERREYFAETDETVNRKAKAAFAHGLLPIVCVGENLEQRESGKTKELVRDQVIRAVEGLSSEQAKQLVIAYEPVWAIGTGKSSSAEDAQEVIAFIRSMVEDAFDSQVASQVRIQYGGSVKPDNIMAYLEQPDIDGALVGGASLAPDSFLQLVEAVRRQ
ncbi:MULTISPECIES: triose-phosphate isomerase [Aneurinibacillus]|jgi:triosephosphate isomerase|uniref:Triosephosphate isomerase n=1 Tax=Aneurinibacillus thermoaerophilus TaxID=143495 RepID=A0A1G8ER83_ANETH|nr:MULTISPECIES: triose-phosphate isomerase [Aneurinibacillus]AMA71799.1 triose-phosphate isomerase [Aneurinibacillus sp. XH2]MED0677359.1 triose-phosphate isomerase [Aneurinibacillus thermoaerophilus]MED0677720.1 triose-phosphate isomerase [Aneurinibacillus thermoaerophilus]MED0737035.1 triose-phosphate isomerase [Aneurinibacillus thermoaerophilus]MED0755865.1 triose-phosphate isomerase [Aneurinibacillus thermoaerophilus]